MTRGTITAEIIEGKVCPYCGQETQFVNSSEIYGKSYGMIYLCRPCEAWVGCHGNGKRALGRLANKELREAKKKAHYYFDWLWQRKMKKHGCNKKAARTKAYHWLAKEMNIPVERCHIGMMDVEQCNLVVTICRPYFKY